MKISRQKTLVQKLTFIGLLALFLLESTLVHGGKVTNSKSKSSKEVPAFFLKIAKTIPRMGKRDLYSDDLPDNFDVDDNPPYPEESTNYIHKRRIGYPAGADSTPWQNFPLSIEGPSELWKTLASYSDEPLYKTPDNFNDDLWMRDKRMDYT